MVPKTKLGHVHTCSSGKAAENLLTTIWYLKLTDGKYLKNTASNKSENASTRGLIQEVRYTEVYDWQEINPSYKHFLNMLCFLLHIVIINLYKNIMIVLA